ncbi:PspA/IM30 family protein [Pseudoxanthomonas sp. F37]|uniref:PspA/IM30 family protein n=1 Tax=Pseudoxanthomonas TaxID=83618 RepID=UPI001FD50BB2|nr:MULTISPECIES: PspA/IM30 family protein [Pseudoxanthomonas]UOV04158.1 PspA/IM30 family protein [Pseudoxanthomonas mexicana]UOV09141.1 PspA/IM30 family protein [Pseudoxanthomonas sp. F37]
MPDTLKTLFRRIQEGMEGLTGAILGDRAERLLDQEIRAIDDALHGARGEHAGAKARRVANEQHQAALTTRIGETEASVEAALRQGRATQARSAAEDVVRLQAERSQRMEEGQALATHERQFAHVVEQLEGRLRRLKHQLDILRASNSLQRAQATVARRQPGEALYPEPAFASAARMKSRRAPARAGGTGIPGKGKSRKSDADPAQAVLDRARKRITSSARKR